MNTLENTIRNLVTEAINQLTEIDWEGRYKDVQKQEIEPSELADYLNRVIANRGKKHNDRERFTRDKPFLHANSALIGQEVNINEFITRITQKPKNILGDNEKMQHSGRSNNEYFIKIGVPPFRGIVYDLSDKKFYNVSTCPGAGACINVCYVFSGNYIMFPKSFDKMTRVLNYLLNYPDEFKAQLKHELINKLEEVRAYKDSVSSVMLRINDSGDFFGHEYYKICRDIITELRSEGYRISGQAHTKMANIANINDPEISTSFSTDASIDQQQKVDYSKKKTSTTFPRIYFKDVDIKTMSGREKILDRVAEVLNLDRNLVKSYQDIMTTKDNGIPKFFGVVFPGDGDDLVNRGDVLKIIHTQHGTK